MRPALLLACLALAAPALAVVNLPPDAGIGVHTVDIADLRFHPQVLVVGLGSTVTWVNHDDEDHTATDFLTQQWGTDVLGAGQSGSVAFAQPGAWVYFCVFHSGMFGVLVVAAEPPA
ncbi:MAG: cupredoxin domain-containing protein [Halobacteriales archaeon]|nr:cupredoxin domain-containing protein [Halobacteriales archaeon]